MRNLFVGFLASALVLGVTGYFALFVVSDRPPHRTAPAAVQPAREDPGLAARTAELEKRLAELAEDNRRLADRVSELEVEALSLGAAVDDVQGIALRNSFDLESSGVGDGILAGGVISREQALAGIWSDSRSTSAGSSGEEAVMVAEVAVDPVFDQAVRQVLTNMETERRQERQERLELRERERFDRMAERMQLTAGQLAVVEESYLKRRASFEDLRLRMQGGGIDRDFARQQSRAIQEAYRAEISAVLTPEQTSGVLRMLDPRRGDGRGNDQRGNDSRGGGQQGARQGGQQGAAPGGGQGGARQR
jgi:Spy/CpxP family protein refolding chaperone